MRRRGYSGGKEGSWESEGPVDLEEGSEDEHSWECEVHFVCCWVA